MKSRTLSLLLCLTTLNVSAWAKDAPTDEQPPPKVTLMDFTLEATCITKEKDFFINGVVGDTFETEFHHRDSLFDGAQSTHLGKFELTISAKPYARKYGKLFRIDLEQKKTLSSRNSALPMNDTYDMSFGQSFVAKEGESTRIIRNDDCVYAFLYTFN
jgi:hypothetical protein